MLCRSANIFCVPIEFAARLEVTEILFFQVGCVSDIEGGHIVCDSFCLIGFSSLLGTELQKEGVSMTMRERFDRKACQFSVRICEHSIVQMFHAFVRCNFSSRHLECIHIRLNFVERGTSHSEHFRCGRNILRLPHADGFAQFHNKLFLIRLRSWLVVVCSNCSAMFRWQRVQERANVCGDC